MKKASLAVLWTVVWLPAVFFATGLSMLGDPVEGGYEQQQLIGRSVLGAGVVILTTGYWMIFRKRSR